jgi:hypothetical protein
MFRPLRTNTRAVAAMSAAAFAGEIQGLLNVVPLSQAAEGVLQAKRFLIDDHPFLVFEANVSKIGFLPAPLASKVAEFYSVARGIAVDFRTLYKGEVPAGFSEEAFRLNLSRDLGTLEPKAFVLVAELQKEAVRDWKQVLQPN